MHKNDLLKFKNGIVRILETTEDKVLVIDCIKRTVPKWYSISNFKEYKKCNEEELFEISNITPLNIEDLDSESRKIAYQKYTLISGVLPFIGDDKERCYVINKVASQENISRQTVIKTLCLYLVYQNISVLAPKKCSYERPLTKDEKNIRWALNKFFYTKNQNSLKTAYTQMLKEKYCDNNGNLLDEYPSIYQFRYFYRKHKSLQNFYISRNGIKDYQRNNRPLLGDGVQEFAPNVGVGMLDSTVCDIYLVNNEGCLIGRPILTACIDAYSSLCCGYSLTLEGGVYSLRNLMLNVITDKTEHCRRHGISIKKEEWNCSVLPSKLVTDMGKEYASGNFEQIADLGVTIVNLPPYRPELKGVVEKFFDIIQDLYKPYLKGKGVIEVDFRERGTHDYRKDARLTMEEFEKIIIYCIIYYNNQRILENFPYTEKMITEGVKPNAISIWNYGVGEIGANLITTNYETLVHTLLPRTIGKFSRKGLIVNKLRYRNEDYTEEYLKGNSVTVAYNPEDVSKVWLIENDKYIDFNLIETRFEGKGISEVECMKEEHRNIIKAMEKENIQAKINLAKRISIIASSSINNVDTEIKGIRDNRKREQRKMHIDYIREGVVNE